jgi:hypothetical protein
MSVQNGLGFHLRRCGCIDAEGIVEQAARWPDRCVGQDATKHAIYAAPNEHQEPRIGTDDVNFRNAVGVELGRVAQVKQIVVSHCFLLLVCGLTHTPRREAADSDKFRALPDADAKKVALSKVDSWKRRDEFPNELVTLPGESYPSSALVDACSTLLLAPKSAALK